MQTVLGGKCYHLCSWELGYLLLPRGVSVYRDNVALFKKKKNLVCVCVSEWARIATVPV